MCPDAETPCVKDTREELWLEEKKKVNIAMVLAAYRHGFCLRDVLRTSRILSEQVIPHLVHSINIYPNCSPFDIYVAVDSI